MGRYKFYIADNKVIAVSSYAGKTVKGVAKCSPEDTFDVEKGKQLAAARCNAKIAEKREKRAWEKVSEAEEAVNKASEYYDKMRVYCNDSVIAREEAETELDDILESL